MALIGFGSRRFLILLLANAVFLKLNSLANARPIDSAYSITNLASPPSIGVTWTGQDAAGEWLESEFVAEPTSLARQPITWNNGRVAERFRSEYFPERDHRQQRESNAGARGNAQRHHDSDRDQQFR
jgi:hypothetical protein